MHIRGLAEQTARGSVSPTITTDRGHHQSSYHAVESGRGVDNLRPEPFRPRLTTQLLVISLPVIQRTE